MLIYTYLLLPLLSLLALPTTATTAFHLRLTPQNTSTTTPYTNNLLVASYQDFSLTSTPYYALTPLNTTTNQTTPTIFHIHHHTLHAYLPVNGTGKKTTKYSVNSLVYGEDVQMVPRVGRDVYLRFNESDGRLSFVPEPMATTDERSWRVCGKANGAVAVFLGGEGEGCTEVFLERVVV